MWILLMTVLAAGGSAALTFYFLRNNYNTGRAIYAMRDGVLILDQQQNIVSMNAQFAHYIKGDASAYNGKPYATLLEQFDINEHALTNTNGYRTEVIYNGFVLETSGFPILNTLGHETGRVIVFRDVTERSQKESRLGNRLEKLIALRRVYGEISEKLDVQTVLMFALDGAMRLSGADAGYIAIKRADGRFEAGQVVGPTTPETVNRVLNSNGGIVNRVIRNETAEYVADVHADADYMEALPRTEAMIIVPLFSLDEELLGVLTLVTYRANRFSEDVFEFIQLLSNRISAGVSNAQLYEQVQMQLEELKASNAQIVELEKLKTEMIRIAAHDLGTPLSIIMMRIQIMERAGDITPDVAGSIQEIMEAAQGIERLRRNILSLEKIEQMASGNVDRTAQVNLYEKTSLIVDSMNPLAFRKNITLQLAVPETDRHVVYGEEDQLYEAITNLVSNAIKYTTDGGDVRVSLTREADATVLKVADTGIGIPQDQQRNLFKPFQRIKMAETRDIEGTGLGLHLVRSIIERHGGTILFESEYGRGSTFGFRMPVAKEDTRVADQP
ncbi:MAG: PAS domain-containing sensor histidine kinase [Chloroflexota bacterium]